ncbi:MAG: magnesium transporter CorA family protein [Chlamydiae bacterium]|jgi:magnesium transporter|nr:magnesium transporter CorA family protein [Chlamydiota bacterium]
MYTSYFKEANDPRFHIVSSPTPDCWIHAENATLDDIERLSKVLKVESEDIKDALDMMEIARIERIEKDSFVVYVRFPYMQEIGVYTATLTIILSSEYLVTICPATCHIIEKLLSEKTTVATNMRAKLLIHILLRIVQEYTKVIRRIRAEVINQEKDISTVSDREITELTRKEENLNQCQNSLQPLKEVIEEILSGKFTILYEKDQDLLEDLLLATEQAEEMCRLSLRIISSLRNSVQVIITNQFNKTIRLLTALTIILTFPTVISSIYGMNIPLPFERSPKAFYFIMGFVFLVITVTLYFFRRRKWL